MDDPVFVASSPEAIAAHLWGSSLPVTALLGAFVAALMIALAFRIIGLHRRERVSIGGGGVPALERVGRAHANLTEWSPVALVLCAVAEWQGAPLWLPAPTALVFAIGRAAHAWSFTRDVEEFRYRAAGMHMTIWPLAGLAAMAVLSLG